MGYAQDLVNAGYYGYAGWGDAEAQADFQATGGAGKGGSSGGGGSGASNLADFANVFAQATGSTLELPPINVKSFEEYEAAALAELRPYYERILKEEGGDVEKAKVRIEEDYQRGIRISREDYEVQKKAYGQEMAPGQTLPDYYNKNKYQLGTFPEEGVTALENINKRGLLKSGIADVTGTNLKSSQQRRQEAIDLALKRYSEQAGITKSRGSRDIGTNWERRQFELQQEQAEKAGSLGRQKRADEISTQEIERENLMRKAVQNYYA